jgi:Mlc titration factor MtfA (ptsG expression regulator)
MYWVSFVSYLILLLITVLLLGYFLGQRFWREYKRKLITNTPFKKSWRKIIQRQVPYFQTMPVDLQLQLKELIQIFIAEKRFVGKSGINIDDEIKVTIAAQACLLLLNRKTDNYPKLTTIVVYPSSFIKEQNNVRANGVVHHDPRGYA